MKKATDKANEKANEKSNEKSPAKSNAKPASKKASLPEPAEVGEPPSDDDRRQEVMEFLVETVEALITERGSDEKIWGSMVKPTMQRRKPGFNESYYGYRSFKELVEDAEKRKLLTITKDEKSGQYTIRLPAVS